MRFIFLHLYFMLDLDLFCLSLWEGELQIVGCSYVWYYPTRTWSALSIDIVKRKDFNSCVLNKSHILLALMKIRAYGSKAWQ
jgi:hypothetical protein